MTGGSVLDDLCATLGIVNEIEQADGSFDTVPEHNRRALLKAMGIAAGDAEREARSLEMLEDQQWERRLPPVVAVRDAKDILSLPLTRPADDDRALEWRLTSEDDAVQQDRIEPAAWPVEASRVVGGREFVRQRLELPRPAAHGYYRLTLRPAGADAPSASCTLIVAPRQCQQPSWLQSETRHWGIGVRLDRLRTARDWGIGDFTDLTQLLELAIEAGADTLALAPLHARGQHRRSAPAQRPGGPPPPYSRLFLEPLHIDVEMVDALGDCAAAQSRLGDEGFQARMRALRSSDRLDPSAVAEAKLAILEDLFTHFRQRDLDAATPAARDFLAFREDPSQAGALESFALHQALTEYFGDDDWPPAYRDPHAPEVAAIAREREARISFFIWLQWLARSQLRAVARRAAALGLEPDTAPGLVQGLAAGAAFDGAEVWGSEALFINAAHLGTAPDPAVPSGGISATVAWHPQALREAGYRPLARLLRAAMQDAGTLRLNALLGLLRPYLVPLGREADNGVYLQYPLDEVLAVLAVESTRAGCAIIGGEAGRLPAALAEAVTDAGILPARILYDARREDEDGSLKPSDIPAWTFLLASTDERPSLTEFWQGSDLDRRRAGGLFADDAAADAALLQRSNDRARLLLALDRAHLLPPESSADPIAVPALTPAHMQAIHRLLARSPARLVLVQAADLASLSAPPEAANVTDGRGRIRRLPLILERWAEDQHIAAVLAAVDAERRRRDSSALDSAAALDSARKPVRAVIPRATYRLQLHAGFGFTDAADLVPYLAELGISHCYFSPYMQARPGSTHGYDVVAHDRLNPELGSRADFDRLCEVLASHGMGQILDMVPNHVGIMGSDNRWWLDVLENGPASQYADWFDIDWAPLKEELRGKVLVPVLGDHYGNILDEGSLKLVLADGGFRVEYYEHHFPIDPREYPRILAPNLARLRERLGGDDGTPAPAGGPETLAAFESLITAFGNLPPRTRLDPTAPVERRRDKELHKQRLAELCAESADIQHYIDECLSEINGVDEPVGPRDALHALLEVQAYRLAYWRVAADEINYRRFFDINDLAALRMENPDTFDATHSMVLELIGAKRLEGLRIDHPDGLYDPAAYFAQLQREAGAAMGIASPAAEHDLAGSDAELPLYLVVEKILTGDEQLPTDWPVHGTTGYDFATLTDALLVDPAGAEPLTQCWRDFSGRSQELDDEVYVAKRLVMRNLLSGELTVLASELARIAETDPHTRDFTLGALRDALMEVVACFPVYRTYISERGVDTRDRNLILKAVAEARRRSDGADLSVFEFVRDVLLTDIDDDRPPGLRGRALRLVTGFQQYTSPVTAKGFEDTALYRWNRLVSLNDVGGEPERFGLSLDAFHRAMARRCKHWPHALLAGSTHDSKRSEDLRARLHLLSELPEQWRGHVERWARLNRRRRLDEDAGQWPDAATEYLFYQTLVGVWPLTEPDAEAHEELRRRVSEYLQKAVKEAKVHTAWTNANAEYETALASFIDAVLDRERNTAFFDDFLPFQQHVARLGLFNALSQTLLRLTAPGVPDIYQGNELWRFDLVDPDNRRPVDFDRRNALLRRMTGAAGGESSTGDHLHAGSAAQRTAVMEDGRAKLHLIRSALRLRQEHPELFLDGDYQALAVRGPHAERLCAFARTRRGECCIVLAPRLLAGLATDRSTGDMPDPFADGGWAQTQVAVPAARLDDRLAGGSLEARPEGEHWLLSAADVLRRFPVGLLYAGQRQTSEPWQPQARG